MSERAKLAGMICADCARSEGGVWPEGHLATSHDGACMMCNRIMSICSWTDWDYPNKKSLNKRAQAREF